MLGWTRAATYAALGAVCLACDGGGSDARLPVASGASAPEAGAAPAPTERVDPPAVDYGEALRSASLKLVGDLPPLADIKALAAAPDQRALYEAKVDAMLDDARFACQMIGFWRDTFKTGARALGCAPDGSTPQTGPDRDAAAVFAAELVTTRRPYTDLFTATSGTCPRYDGAGFVAGDCPGAQPTAGVLTDPALMAQYYGNLAFRRVRFIEETFACSRLPVEYAQPQDLGGAIATSPWPLESVSGGAGATIDFRSTAGLVCINCHGTLNHLAPLFAHFGSDGSYDPQAFLVNRPGMIPAVASDWLPDALYAWRFEVAVGSIADVGRAMTKDPAVVACAVKRAYDFAMSRGDVVDDARAAVPDALVEPLLARFRVDFDFKAVLALVFKSDDFVRF